jgi:hypothetical protein
VVGYDLAELERLLKDPIVDRNGVAQRALRALPEMILHLRAGYQLARLCTTGGSGASPDIRSAALSLTIRLSRCKVRPQMDGRR